MTEPKSKFSGKSVRRFHESIVNEDRKRDRFRLLNMMEEFTGAKEKIWGFSDYGTITNKLGKHRLGSPPLPKWARGRRLRAVDEADCGIRRRYAPDL